MITATRAEEDAHVCWAVAHEAELSLALVLRARWCQRLLCSTGNVVTCDEFDEAVELGCL